MLNLYFYLFILFLINPIKYKNQIFMHYLLINIKIQYTKVRINKLSVVNFTSFISSHLSFSFEYKECFIYKHMRTFNLHPRTRHCKFIVIKIHFNNTNR